MIALPTGKYVLKELEVPDGYEKAADVNFEIIDELIVGADRNVYFSLFRF